ncbi:hypothetical protein, partial [Streptomyces scabiei]
RGALPGAGERGSSRSSPRPWKAGAAPLAFQAREALAFQAREAVVFQAREVVVFQAGGAWGFRGAGNCATSH